MSSKLADNIKYDNVELAAENANGDKLYIGKYVNWCFIVEYKGQDAFVSGEKCKSRAEIIHQVPSMALSSLCGCFSANDINSSMTGTQLVEVSTEEREALKALIARLPDCFNDDLAVSFIRNL